MTQMKIFPHSEQLPEATGPIAAPARKEPQNELIRERHANEVRALLSASQRALAQAEGSRALLTIKENSRSLTLTHEFSSDQLLEALLSSNAIPLVARGPRIRPISGADFSFKLGSTEFDDTLNNLDRDSQSLRSEHGTHSLFLSLGTLQWTENGTENESPLILVPVSLHWKRESGGWELRSSGGDIEVNPALREHVKTHFGVCLPEIQRQEGFSFEDYAALVTRELGKIGKHASVNALRTTLGIYFSGSLALQQDLDPQNWPKEKDPTSHPFLQALVDGSLRHEAPAIAPRGAKAENRFWVLNADSSQQAVLAKVRSGADVLVQGPPGSGKSTTIVNITADALAQGKRVLIVSEKSDALRVAKHWLDYAGIGDTALIIEPGSSRRSINEEIARTLTLGRPSKPDRAASMLAFESAMATFEPRPGQLAQLVGKSGLSAYEVLSRVVADRAQPGEDQKLTDASMLAWTPETLSQVTGLFEKLGSLYSAHGHPRELPPCASESVQAVDAGALSSGAAATHAALTSYLEGANSVCNALGVEVPPREKQLTQTLKALRSIDRLFSEEGELVREVNFAALSSPAQQEEYIQALQRQRQLADTFEKSKGLINFGCLAVADLDRISSCLDAHEKKFFKFFDGDYTYALESLQRIAKVPPTLAEQKTFLKRLREIKELLSKQDADNTRFSELLGEGWDRERPLLGEVRFCQRASQLVHALADFSQSVRGLPNAAAFEQLLKSPSAVYALSEKIDAALLLSAGYERERTALFGTLGRSDMSDLATFSDSPLPSQESRLSVWRFHPEGFEAARQYAALREQAKKLGVSALVDSVENSGNLRGLPASLRRGYYSVLAERLIKPSPVVTSFDPERIRSDQQDLEAAHASLQRANAEEIAFRHWTHIPRSDVGGQASALLRETQKRAGHRPLRELFTETSEALQRVKPVMLMSPQTAAKVLDPAGLGFDMVIFDEASQVKPHSALGAIARAKQVVIVGDPEQLDPTSFFERHADKAEKEHTRSLIDLVENAGMQRDELAWHYRSRYPGLIQPSNEAFYRGRLKVFPSPEKGEGADGFVYRPVPQGIYDAGRTRTNKVEALAIAQAVLTHAQTNSHQSLGVVALSRPQMEAIQEEVERLRRTNPVLDRYLARESAESFFIRNLETSQGVERDRIMISVGYARTAEGELSLNFGPISTERGANRLNVLLSRARVACEIFTSLRPDEPEFLRSTNTSVQTLNKLLRRMEDGAPSQQGALTSFDPDPVKDMVKRALENLGYTVHSSFGADGQGLDLAVMDRHQPRYLLGILFDGPPQAEGANTEDREIIRRQALRERGWNILQQSVVEWYQDPVKALATLERALVNATLPPNAPPTGDSKLKPRIVARSNVAVLSPLLAEPYKTASVKLSAGEALRRGEARLAKAELARCFHEILKVEAPIHSTTMHERLSESAGALKWAAHFDEIVEEVEAEAIHGTIATLRSGFLYAKPEQRVTVRDRSALRGAAKEVAHIPPEEIELAILKVAEHSLRISRDELPQAVSRLLGFSKMPVGIDSITESSLAGLIGQGLIGEQNGFVARTDARADS